VLRPLDDENIAGAEGGAQHSDGVEQRQHPEAGEGEAGEGEVQVTEGN
jgi:hypothetical protein